jgi:predicted alpha/beta superfamily hydrolase
MKLFCLVLIAVCAIAQERTSPLAFLPDVSTSIMKSSATGRAYQISVALPDGYSREHAPYPVLYAADANVQFGTLVETARVFAQIPPLIIVGIGYETRGQGFVWGPRAVDLAPAPNAGSPGSGHAPDFLDFIRNDLVPSIERNYNAGHDRASYGHSFGALFGLYALFHNDGLFRRFIIGSPSIWEAKAVIQSSEEAFAATGRPLAARVFFSVGLLEQSGSGAGMVSDVRELIRVLERRHYRDFDFQVHYFEDENHFTVIPATMGRGLRYIYPQNPN